jgi:hypothetical protein
LSDQNYNQSSTKWFVYWVDFTHYSSWGSYLQYADDTIVCLKHDMTGAINLKFLLYMYEMLAGLKINFNKSKIIMINDEENLGQTYAELFNCQI